MNQGGIASQTLNFFVWDNETTNRLRQVNEEGRIADVVFSDLSWVASCSQVFSWVGAKDWQADNRVADHGGSILDQQGVENAHPKLEPQHMGDVLEQFAKAGVNLRSFPLVPLEKSYFFRVGEQFSLNCAIFAFQLLLACCQFTECRWDCFYNQAG